MHRLWMLFDPRQVMTGIAVALLALALTIHFILLSLWYNWLGDPNGGGLAVSTHQEALRPVRSAFYRPSGA